MRRAALLVVLTVIPGVLARAERPPIQEVAPADQAPRPWQPPVGQPAVGQPAVGQPVVVQPPFQTQPPSLLPPTRGPYMQPNGSQVNAPQPSSPQGLDQADQGQPAAGAVQPQWPNQWVPAHAARLQALDKVNAQTAALTVKLGQPTMFGSLTITLKACMVRPPDQPADAAAYLDVTDSHPDQPGFNGWLLANEPSVSLMQNPVYDLRVSGCG